MNEAQLQKHLAPCRPWISSRPVGQDFVRGQLAALADTALARAMRRDEMLFFDPLRLADSDFIKMAQRLQIEAAGPLGMPMEPWVSYDCGLFPGMMCGLSMDSAALPAWILRALQMPEVYQGPVSVASMTLTPMLADDSWELLNLASLNQVSPGSAPAGLKRLSLLLLGSILRDRTIWASSRWRAPLLSAAASLSRLDLHSAWTPAQDLPQMATFSFRPAEDWNVARLAPRADLHAAPLIDVDDDEVLQNLQRQIEAGQLVRVLAAGQEQNLRMHFAVETDAQSKVRGADGQVRR